MPRWHSPPNGKCIVSGHIYILINASLPGLLKIGMTARSPDHRARELSQGTGIPSPFLVAYSEDVPDCESAEALIHERLARFRVSEDREFFRLQLKQAIRVLTLLAEKQREDEEFAEKQRRDAEKRRSRNTIDGTPAPKPLRDSELSTLLSVLQKRFKNVKNVYFHLDIQTRKQENVLQKYSALLDDGEEVFLVYDGTLFGSAKTGFILTDRGIGWSESFAPPNYCSYHKMKRDEICNGWLGFYMQGD